MSFLPFAILGYALVGGSLLVNKIQIQTRQISPLSYTFYAGIFQGLVILLIPFGFNFNFSQEALSFAIFSGVFFVLALLTLFSALKISELSVVGPLVGTLNPLFSLIVGVLFLNQFLTPIQFQAFFVLIFGAAVLTYGTGAGRLVLNRPLILMVLSGFLFGLSYVFLRETFLQTSFLNGLILSRLSASFFALIFLLFIPKLKYQQSVSFGQKLLFLFGQVMAGGANLAIFFAVSLANPALVNSLFGIQYLIILFVALILYKNHSKLLDERLTKGVIFQKTLGAAILSFGVYLLTK